MIRIGIDFDNTIVCYDEIFHQLAIEHGYIPESVPKGKQAVRDRLRASGKEKHWIELQGEVYGRRMSNAAPYQGVERFLARCANENAEYAIVSHKTAKPAAGPAYDLHAAAREWLQRNLTDDTGRIGVFFETTRDRKLERIRRLDCDYFIDDLPEFLTLEGFPEGVERLLFDPMGTCPNDSRYRRVRSWREIGDLIFASPTISETVPHTPFDIATALLEMAGLGIPVTVEQVQGGANNRVCRVETVNSRYALKIYFSDPLDPRDRLKSEYAFTSFARDIGLGGLHQPLASDFSLNAALYTFAEGRPFQRTSPGWPDIEQAMDLVVALNREKAKATDLPPASEACFTIAQHLETVDHRMKRLARLVTNSDAREFIRNDLLPVWRDVSASVKRFAGHRLSEPIAAGDKVLSPSDFGFHNALKARNGHITFVDFEYAGWDDPAHMICDFFSQIAVPVSGTFLPYVISRISSVVSDTDWLRERVDLLMPVYRAKWCGILLNDFLETGRRRRQFSGNSTKPEILRRQLQRAKAMRRRIEDPIVRSLTG